MFRMWDCGLLKNEIDFRSLIIKSTSIEYQRITRKTTQLFYILHLEDSLKKQAVS